ncbi:hypothetical protein MUN84_20535 [Hymenobacter sp. 5516J-16]|uniref:DUF7033 domain-containing protein n=1 Tax=Hymenobacter sp. 5516J-16 TaxID=2932253 RepID=UPI001FD39ACD|nr:hypothetical protein [Hymenobacter sp. 5516J-16]UOQ76853.1 hypothetical protein MUN84_20535 [Hymenobacter sp. 5516J-16]
MLPPPLPAVAPVAAETRIAYVLRHFQLAYEAVPLVSIGYADTQPHIEIAEAAGSFFEQQQPYPSEPTWREWQGQRIPVFFDSEPQKPLLELLSDGHALIHADILSGAFYLLSGWQEFFSEERDQHGRFPYAASVQHRFGFVTMPVVNYYFDVLKTAVEHVSGKPLRPRCWPNGATWAAFITHDIDNLQSAWKAPAKAALRQGQLLSFGRQLWRHFTTPTPGTTFNRCRKRWPATGQKHVLLPARTSSWHRRHTQLRLQVAEGMAPGSSSHWQF